MKPFDSIGRYLLQKGYKPNNHKRRAVNLSEVTRLVVIASGSTEEMIKQKVRHFKIIQSNWGIPQVDFWIYIPQRKLPEWASAYADSFHVLTKKYTNWYGKPTVGEGVEPFDLLIDLDRQANTTSLFLTATLKAKMKVCMSHKEKEPYFDFFITVKGENALTEYVKQTEHYLRILNNKKAEHGAIQRGWCSNSNTV